MSVTIQQRGDTAANWTAANPVLHQRELGVETDTEKMKLGDGVTAWASLAYWTGAGAGFQNPMTTPGDTLYEGAGPAAARLAGPTAGAAPYVLSSTPSGGVAQSPAWLGVGAANGVGSLDSSGRQPAAQQPLALTAAGITGTNGQARLVGSVTSGPPASGTFAAMDTEIDGTGRIWICTTAGTPGTWMQVIPSPPNWFYPEDYGARGDGVVVNDAVMTSGSPNIACTTTVPFTSTAVDAGKHVLVSTAAGAYAHLHLTVSTVTDTGHAVLSGNATASTAGTPGAIMYFGTDDTTAFESCRAAMEAYAAASGNKHVRMVLKSKVYIIAGAFQTGAAGNYQIRYPVVATSARQLVYEIVGPVESAQLEHWQQQTPQNSGAILASPRTDGTATGGGSNGPSCILGGPVSGYGGEPGLFSNVLVRVIGVGFLTPYNSTLSGMSLFGALQAHVRGVRALTAAVAVTGTSAPSMSNVNNISNQWTYGIQMPCAGNQTVCLLEMCSAEGYTYGFGVSEWTHMTDGHAMYCIGALGAYSGNGVGMVHHIKVDHLQAENCGNAIIQVDTGIKRIRASIGTESISAAAHVYDPSNLIYGDVDFYAQGSNGTSNNYAGGHGLNLRMRNMMTTPGTLGPPAVPLTTVAAVNYYGRNVTAYITSGGAAVTAITVTPPGGSPITTGATLGATGTVAVSVPIGWAIALTYASTAPTWIWTGD